MLPDAWEDAVKWYRLRGVTPRVSSRTEAIASLLDGSCIFCNRVGFKMVSQHTRQAHGVSSQDLHDLCHLANTTPFVSPEHVDKLRQIHSDRLKALQIEWRERGGSIRGHKQRLSPAKKDANRAKALLLARDPRRIDALREKFRTDLEFRAKAADNARKGSAASAKARARPHPCVVCGKVIPKGRRKTCSPEHSAMRSSVGQYGNRPSDRWTKA